MFHNSLISDIKATFFCVLTFYTVNMYSLVLYYIMKNIFSITCAGTSLNVNSVFMPFPF